MAVTLYFTTFATVPPDVRVGSLTSTIFTLSMDSFNICVLSNNIFPDDVKEL
jgi:hypothetical protein